jgi:hypothetical protein
VIQRLLTASRSAMGWRHSDGGESWPKEKHPKAAGCCRPHEPFGSFGCWGTENGLINLGERKSEAAVERRQPSRSQIQLPAIAVAAPTTTESTTTTTVSAPAT